MAWKGGHFIFVEYEAPDERPPRSQPAWIDAALDAGVSEHDLFIVTAATT